MLRAALQVSSCPCCEGRLVTPTAWSLKDSAPTVRSASYKIPHFGNSIFRLWFKPLKLLALGVWKAPVSLDGTVSSWSVLGLPSGVQPQKQSYLLVHVLRSKECLVGSWAALLSWCGDLPWAMQGRWRCRLHPGLHCQGSIGHLLHKPLWQHFSGDREGTLRCCFYFSHLLNKSVSLVSSVVLQRSWIAELLALKKFFSLKFRVSLLWLQFNCLAWMAEWLANSQDELYVCLNACGFGV